MQTFNENKIYRLIDIDSFIKRFNDHYSDSLFEDDLQYVINNLFSYLNINKDSGNLNMIVKLEDREIYLDSNYFIELSSNEVISTFIENSNFGINVKSVQEVDSFSKIKNHLSATLNKSFDLANDATNSSYGSKTILFNDATYSESSFIKNSDNRFHYIPFTLFNTIFNQSAYSKGTPMLKFTKDYLLTTIDKYYIVINSDEDQFQLEKIFKANNMPYPSAPLYSKHKSNTTNDNIIKINNQGTWTDNYLENSDIAISSSKWLQIINKINDFIPLSTFKQDKLYYIIPHDKVLSYNNRPKEITEDYAKNDIINESRKHNFLYSESIGTHFYTALEISIPSTICKEVTPEIFFKKFFQKEDINNPLRFQLYSETDEGILTDLLHKFEILAPTNMNTYSHHGAGSYINTHSRHNSESHAKSEGYELLPISILSRYTDKFAKALEDTTYPILDISTIQSDPSRIDNLSQKFNISKQILNKRFYNYITLLSNGSFYFSIKRPTKSKVFNVSTENDFEKIFKEQVNISTNEMIEKLFNNGISTPIPEPIPEPVTAPIIEDLMKIKNISFQKVMNRANILSGQICISIQTKNQLSTILNLFKEYGVPYPIHPPFKRGMNVSVSKSLQYPVNEPKIITADEFFKLEQNNMDNSESPYHIKRKMKYFYIKKIGYKHYLNDKEICIQNLHIQGNVVVDTIPGSAKRYFAAKDLGINHDGLEEKSERVMKQIINELDSPEAIADKEHVLLIGQSGSGKTTIAEKYFNDKDQKFVKQQGFSQLSGDDLLGYISITNQEYRASLLKEAAVNGWGYILDEADACNPNTLLIFNALKSDTMQFPDEKIIIHSDFRLIFTANTLEFSEKYNARAKFDHATKARFSIINYNLTKLDLAERYSSQYIKQIENVMDLDPREIQRKVRHIKQNIT